MREVIDACKGQDGGRILLAFKQVQFWLSIPRVFCTPKERFDYSQYTKHIFENITGQGRKYGNPEDQIHQKLMKFLSGHSIIDNVESADYEPACEFLTVILDCLREFILGIRNPRERVDSTWHANHHNNIRSATKQWVNTQGIIEHLNEIISKFTEVTNKNVNVIIAVINCFSAMMERDTEIVNKCILLTIRVKIMNFYDQAFDFPALMMSLTSAISIMSGNTQLNNNRNDRDDREIIRNFMKFFVVCRNNDVYKSSEKFSREVQISLINILKTMIYTLPFVVFNNDTKAQYLEYIEEFISILILKSDHFLSISIKEEVTSQIMYILYELISLDGAKGGEELANFFLNHTNFRKSIQHQLRLGMDNKKDMSMVSDVTLSFVELLIKYGNNDKVAKYLGQVLILKLNSPHGRNDVIDHLMELLKNKDAKIRLLEFGIVESFVNLFMKFKTQVLSETRGETIVSIGTWYEFDQINIIINALIDIFDNNCSDYLFSLDNIETIGSFLIILEVELKNGNIYENHFEGIDEVLKLIKKLFEKVIHVKILCKDFEQIKKQCTLIFNGLEDKIKSAKEQGMLLHSNDEDGMESSISYTFFPLECFLNGEMESHDSFKCIFTLQWNHSDKQYNLLPRKIKFVELVEYFSKLNGNKMELQYKIPTMSDSYHTISSTGEFEEYLEKNIKASPSKLYFLLLF
jgi:hypothetical protein